MNASCIASTPIALLLTCLLSTATSLPAKDEQTDPKRVAVVAYAANRQSFPFYTCRFTITRASAASREDAIAGRWFNSSTTDHKLQVDNDLELYEDLSQPPPALKAPSSPDKRGLGFETIAGVSSSYLSDGKNDLLHTPGMSVINVFNEQQPAPGPKITPWSYGMFGHRKRWFGPDGLDANPQEFERLSGNDFGLAQFEGRPVVSVGYKARSTQGIRRFLLDPAQGYLPVYASWETDINPPRNGVPPAEALLTHARECSKGRWFPERVLLLQHFLFRVETDVKVTEIRVTSLEVDKRPAKDSFAITAPAGTRVCSDLRSHNFVLKQEEMIQPENIPALFERMDKAATNPEMESVDPRHSTSSRRLLLYALAGAALLASGYYLRRLVGARRARLANATVPGSSVTAAVPNLQTDVTEAREHGSRARE